MKIYTSTKGYGSTPKQTKRIKNLHFQDQRHPNPKNTPLLKSLNTPEISKAPIHP